MSDNESKKHRSGAPVPENYTGPGMIMWVLIGTAIFVAALFLFHVWVATIPVFAWLADTVAVAIKWLLLSF
ncbi:hypothetical protein [Phyllobacterium phragmitis]|uniref:Uncharacterized protein n=1 Tax=Phyllobacterium phragmitis TaxID=2670329 RepID=A0ABQ0H5J0_9HYPH